MGENKDVAVMWACLKCGKVFYDTEKDFVSRGRRCKECAENGKRSGIINNLDKETCGGED